MLLALFGVISFLIIILFIYAQLPDKAIIGVFASLIMLVLGAWLFTDPIAIQTSSNISGENISRRFQSVNENIIFGTSEKSINITANSSYTSISAPSYFSLSLSEIIGLILASCSMFGMLHYGLIVGRDLNA